MRLVERIAELINEKKLPLVADVRDESAEDIRLVIEPRARTVDPELMMESLFKLTELESRIPLNMNVLVKGKIPRVIGLAEALREWLDHRRDVLLRRSNYRLKQISHRLEVLGGYLIAYLNLDRVIKIIRTEDEPKPVLMKAFKLTDVQAEAILNMRLRNLRKLEEMEIRKEDKELRAEKKSLEELVKSETKQWETIAAQIKELKEKYGRKTPIGKRRTDFAEAPEHDEAAIEEAMVVREPVTVVLSDKGWVRALRGHVEDLSSIAFKQDDKLKLSFFAETTSKLLMFATNGRFYTLEASKLPGGRGHGEPVRLFIDLEQEGDIVTMFPVPGRAQIHRREPSGQGLCRHRGRMPRHDAQGQAGAQRQGAGRGARGRHRRGRAGREHRRQSQDADLPARAIARDGARLGRAAAALQGRRAVRREDLQGRGRPDLDRRGRARIFAHAQGTVRLARQPRRRRPPGAEGIPADATSSSSRGSRFGPVFLRMVAWRGSQARVPEQNIHSCRSDTRVSLIVSQRQFCNCKLFATSYSAS